MRPLRIYLKNFMNHSLSEIDCTNFQSVLIVGKSRKNDRISNGVGKTTLFRGIEYALFNQSHATTLDKVVRDGKRKAIVEFDFELGGEVYRIYRHRASTGSSDVRLYKKIGDDWESITERTASATDAKIREMIKITHKAFTYSVLFRQADLTGITSVSDPKKRREILKEPLNLSQYTKLEDLAIKKLRPLKKEISKLEGSIEVLGEPDNDITFSKEFLEKIVKRINDVKSDLVSAEDTLKEKRKALDSLKSSLNAEDSSIQKEVSSKESDLKSLTEDNTKTDNKIQLLGDTLNKRKDSLSKLTQELLEVNESLTEKNKKNTVDVEELQLKYDKVCDDEIKGSEILSAAKTKLKYIQKSLPDDDTCPACHQSIEEDYRKKIEQDVQLQLKNQQSEIDFVEEALTKCRRKKTRLGSELTQAKALISDIEKLEGQSKSITEAISDKRESIASLEKDQVELVDKSKTLTIKIKETTESLNQLKESIDNSNSAEINKKIFNVKSEISIVEDSIKDLNTKLVELSTNQGAVEERITTRTNDKASLKTYIKQLDAKKSEFKIKQMVVDAFSNRGIPAFIIQTVLDELQYEANSSLKELRPELDVQIDADLNFEYRRNGIVRAYEQLSHGQHVYIALAFKRGTARVIQKRLGIDIRMLEFDEVDAHLDEAGADAFADAIRKWQQDFTIFVITHNKDLKDKFSHAILVEEDDDGAQARLVTTW